MNRNARRFVFDLFGLAVLSGLISGALPAYLMESRQFTGGAITGIYFWPGTIFGLFIALYLQARGVFEGARGWVMVPVSTLSFPVTLMAGTAFDETLGAPELIALPVGAGIGGFLFMLGAAALSRVYRSAAAVVLGSLASALLMFLVSLFGRAFEGGDWWVILTVVTAWQAGFALTLGLLAVWRAGRIGGGR